MTAAISLPLRRSRAMRTSRRSLRRLLPSGGLVAFGVVLASLVALLHPKTFPVRSVRFEGDFRYLQPNELQALIGEELRSGFFHANLRHLRAALLVNPWIREASVRRVWPDRLQIRVWEERAVARWVDGGFLNDGGEYFEREGGWNEDGLPLLNGPPGTQRQVLERLRAWQSLFAPHGLTVTQLELSERRSWKMRLNNGWLVMLGKDDLERRVRRTADIALKVLQKHSDRVERVDMRYPYGYAVRWKGTGIAEPLQR